MKQKKIPMRTCVITKERYPKGDLIRVVRETNGNVSVDLTGKKNGRGAYLKKDIEVIELAEKTKQLEKFLEVNVPDEVYEELKRNINN